MIFYGEILSIRMGHDSCNMQGTKSMSLDFGLQYVLLISLLPHQHDLNFSIHSRFLNPDFTFVELWQMKI